MLGCVRGSLVQFTVQGVYAFHVREPDGIGVIPSCFLEAIWHSGRVVKVNVLQCALGLVVGGQPAYTNIVLLQNSIFFIEPFEGLKCICSSHGTLEGRIGNIAKVEVAQVWPREVCHRICIGMQSPIGQLRTN